MMPRRRVVVIGSGPITIGQGAEFDYAGTQAVEALHEEGVEVVLVNPNPATVMTDPGLADRVYLEPLTPDSLVAVLERERPDGLLPTLGGQAGLNLAVALDDRGDLQRLGVEVLGTPLSAIRTAEDRARFRALMLEIGEPVPNSQAVGSLEAGRAFAAHNGLPLVVRPAFTLGGTGGGLVRSEAELEEVLGRALTLSPVRQALLERSIEGWIEVEVEVLRDGEGSAIAVCTMENFDPVGVHTGDSIVVAPILTLPDPVVQRLRKAALRIAHALGLVGGANVQFGVSPDHARYTVIEVNPRVSRSSALASKATGYPIARVAARLALGRHLAEMANPVAEGTPAALEPAIDYVVVKVPRWPFDKFQAASRRLGTEMRATGEAMAIDRTFRAALQKAVRAIDLGARGLELKGLERLTERELWAGVEVAHDRRLFYLAEALRRGASVEELARRTRIAPFFLAEMARLVAAEADVRRTGFDALDAARLRELKRDGFSDARLAELVGTTEEAVRARRHALGVRPTYKRVDTCAAEFAARTPYSYATYEEEDESPALQRPAVVILGSGPIRIGQGIEFDCSAVHALDAVRRHGYAAVMMNTNPETVSTDASRSDSLVFEPLTVEDVVEVAERTGAVGVIVQFAGQTGVTLAAPLERAGLRILGTAPEGIDLAEDRERFDRVLEAAGIARPAGGTARGLDEALRRAREVGFPAMVRPSFVIGGRAMTVVEGPDDLRAYLAEAIAAYPDRPIRIDRYIPGRELELDAVADGEDATVCGIFAHVERAGVHSGDSIAVFPAQDLDPRVEARAVDATRRLAKALRIRGLLNIQFVVSPAGELGVLEVNPRASRTVPVLEKATGRPIAAWAARLALGQRLADLGIAPGLLPPPAHVAVKVPVWSFGHLPRVEAAVGPEMKSTGEVMALGEDAIEAARVALVAAGIEVGRGRGVLFTVGDRDKAESVPIARSLAACGYRLWATEGTARAFRDAGLAVDPVHKVGRGSPDVIERLMGGDIALVVNTITQGRQPERDGFRIRRAAVERGVPCVTSLDTARLLAAVLARADRPPRPPRPLQAYLATTGAPRDLPEVPA
jgi:carbamoyl-phosphate synthase large subunit